MDILRDKADLRCPWQLYLCRTSCPPDRQGAYCHWTRVLAWSSEVTWLISVCVFPNPKQEVDQLCEFLKLFSVVSMILPPSACVCVCVCVRHKLCPVCSHSLFVLLQTVVSCNHRPQESLLLHTMKSSQIGPVPWHGLCPCWTNLVLIIRAQRVYCHTAAWADCLAMMSPHAVKTVPTL